MPTIHLEADVKKELDELMLQELNRNISNPKIFIKAIKNKYGYTHSEFIAKLLKAYRVRRKEL